MSQAHTPQGIARTLIAREAPHGPDGARDESGVLLQRSCDRFRRNLSDALGDDGTSALLARALMRTEVRHQPLKLIRRVDQGNIQLDGVAAAVEAHGVAEVTTALEALFAAVIDILARLIGEDMAIRIIDHEESPGRSADGGAQ